ncbi:MAG: peptidoglycan recognition family protein [Acidimicrobiia bacterium]
MTAGDPDDPPRRALLRTLAVLGVAAVSSIGARILFGGSGPADVATAQSPLTTSTTTSTTTTTAPTTTPPTTTSSTTTTTVPEPIIVDVISKAGWGARGTGEFGTHELVRLTYHHTASDPAGAPDRIRGYQRYHQDQGWPDVAYHYLIDQAGLVYEGRPVDAPGDTFTEYDPTGHFLPCLDGDFDLAPPSDESIDALVLILAWAAQTFEIGPDTLTGHRDHAATTCPGSFAYELRDQIADRVTALVDAARTIELVLTDREEGTA